MVPGSSKNVEESAIAESSKASLNVEKDRTINVERKQETCEEDLFNGTSSAS